MTNPGVKRTVRTLLVAFGLLVLPTLPARAVEGDPDGQRNQSAGSELPQGDGIAAAFPGDNGIERHPAVRFAENFEEPPDFRDRWDEIRDDNVLSLVENSPPDRLVGKGTLRVRGTLGENTGGGLTKWFRPAATVHVRFYVKFDESCDYVHHFVTLRANKGLSGSERWSGFGGAGVKPAGDERFSTALEPWGNRGRWPAPGRWNFYSYWHTMRASPDGRFWGNAFRPVDQPAIRRGEWICAEFALMHNSPGKDDGEQAFWIDGQLRGHWKGINWRASESLQANALTLEAYITDRWTKQKTNTVYFDNVVIASAYIGPVRQPDAPAAESEETETETDAAKGV
jgi:hypothetical protein